MTVPLTEKGQQLLGVLWMEVVLSLCFIGLRLYTRKFIGGAPGVDDYLLILSWVSYRIMDSYIAGLIIPFRL